MDKFQQRLIESIDILISDRMKKLKYNYTVTAKVTEVLTSPNYKIEINGDESSAKAINGNTYVVNDVVYVMILNNDFSQKIILAKLP